MENQWVSLWITLLILWITGRNGSDFVEKWRILCGKMVIFMSKPVDNLGKAVENLLKTY
ncbi:MAG TPA: hypothetical protein PKE35_14650 [Anaerolineales bacterium]|nr:hypothetical protein [Anaerolineales bacterium]HNA56277.1 hypothetical protein [Anaerolineales bacterium]HNB87853.1 hypothetical protein [Anaerolineales bacterium]HND93388.1 hypothetical protein [Anaerolineales bacterium]HNF33416.1 hypothetical protein [Anaerolineales bacterium]